MPGKVIRFCDYEQRSRHADAEHPRDPAESAVIIILPMIKRLPGQIEKTEGWGKHANAV